MVKRQKSAAIVTIFRPADMTPAGRRRIATWLRRQAGFLQTHGKRMATRFTARYLYKEK
jgi:hypothetical protein